MSPMNTPQCAAEVSLVSGALVQSAALIARFEQGSRTMVVAAGS